MTGKELKRRRVESLLAADPSTLLATAVENFSSFGVVTSFVVLRRAFIPFFSQPPYSITN